MGRKGTDGMSPETNASPKVLIVDDKRENLALFYDILQPYRYQISIATDGPMALESVQNLLPDLILLDVVMPGMDGYEVLQRLKSDKTTSEIPVIFLTARDTPEEIVRGFEAGAVDYIAKPCHPKEMIARVRTHLEKARILGGLKRLMEHSFHELYTPLSVIGSAMEMQELEHGANEYTRMTRAACRTLQNIYDDLYYTLKHPQSHPIKTRFDFVALLRERIHYFTLVAESRLLDFAIDLPPALELFLPRPDMERVVDNLLSNAIKYTPENRTIALTLRQQEGLWHFRISNPVAKEVDLERIFNKYYRDDHAVFGYGLGLDLVRALCKENNIGIRALGGEGSFAIDLELEDMS